MHRACKVNFLKGDVPALFLHISKTRHATTYLLSFYKKEVVPQYEFEKGTWWRDGFWRYGRFKNMPFFFRVSRKGRRGGSLNLVFYGK